MLDALARTPSRFSSSVRCCRNSPATAASTCARGRRRRGRPWRRGGAGHRARRRRRRAAAAAAGGRVAHRHPSAAARATIEDLLARDPELAAELAAPAPVLIEEPDAVVIEDES
ncbi:MAG: hypothetical protein U0168_26125 [Nannocystaceae bacterium]